MPLVLSESYNNNSQDANICKYVFWIFFLVFEELGTYFLEVS